MRLPRCHYHRAPPCANDVRVLPFSGSGDLRRGRRRGACRPRRRRARRRSGPPCPRGGRADAGGLGGEAAGDGLLTSVGGWAHLPVTRAPAASFGGACSRCILMSTRSCSVRHATRSRDRSSLIFFIDEPVFDVSQDSWLGSGGSSFDTWACVTTIKFHASHMRQ